MPRVKDDNKRQLMKDYNDIREMLRLIFVYGCFTGKDISEDGVYSIVSPDGWSDPESAHIIRRRKRFIELNRIRLYLPAGFLKSRMENGNKVWYANYHIYDETDDVLLQTYRTQKATDGQTITYFMMLRLLDGDGKQSELNEILGDLLEAWMEHPPVIQNNPYSKWMAYAADLKRKDKEQEAFEYLKERLDGIERLVDAGLVEHERSTEYEEADNAAFYRARYRLSDDILDGRSDAEILALYDCLMFLSKCSSFCVPYYYAAQKCRLYLMICKEYEPQEITDAPILYRHNYRYTVFDDEITYQILQALDHRTMLRVNYKAQGRTFGADMEYVLNVTTVVPVKLIHDASSGRQYLFCLNNANNAAEALRLDQIITAEETVSVSEEEQKKAEEAVSAFDHAWCASPFDLGKKHHMKILLHYPEGDTYYRKRIRREKQSGKITALDEHTDCFEIDVTDPNEMVPWIRSYGAVMEIVEDEGSKDLIQRMKNQWKEALSAYGSL